MPEAAGIAAGRTAPIDGLPWTQAWLDRIALPPLVCGIGLALAHAFAATLYYLGAERVSPTSAGWFPLDDLVSAAVYGLLIGYAVAGLAYARAGHAAALADLRPILQGAEPAERSEVVRFDRPRLRAVGAVSAVAAALVTVFTTGLLEDLGPRDPRLVWIVWQNVCTFWLASRTVTHDLQVSRRLARLTERRARIDLLDPAPLAPLARRGLQSALLIVAGISIFSLVYSLGNVSPAVPLLQAGTIAMAGLALGLPSLGVHRRLRAAKRRESLRLGEAIRSAREQDDPARLAALLTVRREVAAAREWPFDLGTLGRFALYAAIGVGSWLGGALVERLLDLVIVSGS